MALIENRYAEALLKLSIDENNIDKSLLNLKNIVEVYNNNLELKKFLNSPKIKIIDKKEVIKKIFNSDFEKTVINFILLLLDKGRIKFLPTILEEYIKLINIFKNDLEIIIISAIKLSNEQIKRIELKIKKHFNTTSINSKTKIDKSLIGGVKIIIGDKIYDYSIKYQLENLKNNLKIS
jgi:F-type H+-transporting ATPase subunit delta